MQPAAGRPPMDPMPGVTEAPPPQTVARFEARATDAGAGRSDASGRMEADLRRLADGLLNMLERDRARVTALLGDDIVSVMTMARYLIEDSARRLAEGDLEEAGEALQSAAARIRDASNEVLALCSELHPKVLDDLGLLPALSMYFREFNRENRAIFVSPRLTVAEGDIPAYLKLAMFRIVQAALSNVARHSKASTVRVFLSIFESELRLVVEDNGVGFDMERWRYRRHRHDGCGLGMIQRWAEASGGRCSIEAVPRHGTRVQATWRTEAFSAPEVGVQEAEAEAPPTPA
jgi:two-component system NarL family sensor kinase